MVHYPVWREGKEEIEEVLQDESLKEVIEALKQNCETKADFSYSDGVLFYKGRLVISAKSSWIPILLKEYHSTPQGGHSGFYRTY